MFIVDLFVLTVLGLFFGLVLGHFILKAFTDLRRVLRRKIDRLNRTKYVNGYINTPFSF